jgi:hypothetical protein
MVERDGNHQMKPLQRAAECVGHAILVAFTLSLFFGYLLLYNAPELAKPVWGAVRDQLVWMAAL